MKIKVINTVLRDAEHDINDFLSTIDKEKVFNITYLGSPTADHHSVICIVTYYD